MSYLLMTGATGMLGHYLMRDALMSDIPLAVLSRSTGSMSGAARIEGQLQRWESRLGQALPRPIVLEGNLSEENLGLDSDQIRWVRDNCARVVHSAANVTFHTDPKTGEPYRSNVVGTRQLVSACADWKIREFHYVSTAYVCGDRAGIVRADKIDDGQLCSNDYERSKIEAERIVRSSEWLERPTIYRPSIIVGDSQTGFISAFHGVYSALRLGHLYLLAKLNDKNMDADNVAVDLTDPSHFLTPLGLNGNERKNLVPVEWVSRAIMQIMLRADCHGRTYHLTNPRRVPVDVIKRTMAESVLAHLRKSPTRSPAIPSNYLDDDVYGQFMNVYRSYFRDDPDFDASNTHQAIPHDPCPRLNDTSLVRMWRFALDADFSIVNALPAPPVHDLSARMSRLLKWNEQTSDEDILHVQISGPGGGAWSISFADDGPTGFCEGAQTEHGSSVYMNSNTASALADGRLEIEQAIDSGRLVVTGSDREMSVAVSLLDQLFGNLGRSEAADVDSENMVASN